MSQKTLIIVLVIILVALVAAASFFAFARKTPQTVGIDSNIESTEALNGQLPTTAQSANVGTSLATAVQKPVITPDKATQSTEIVGNTQAPADSINDWNIYTNKDYGFNIKYPQGWKAATTFDVSTVNRPSALMYSVSFGNGTVGNGYDGELFISVYNKVADIETPIKEAGKQFSDRQEKKENISINGISAIKIIITSPTVSSWIYEAVVVKNGNYSYLLNNGAIKNDQFEKFYGSFRIN